MPTIAFCLITSPLKCMCEPGLRRKKLCWPDRIAPKLIVFKNAMVDSLPHLL